MSAPAQKDSAILPESLSGLIERVTFANQDSGLNVLKVKAKGHRDLVTVDGSLPSVSVGEWLTAQGRWVQDRKYGQQFRAEMLTGTPPTSKEGIKEYLGSGMVKGIGPVYAKKLVDKSGEGVFDLIEKASARLEDADGIGPKRRRRIKEAWDEQKVVRNIMLWSSPKANGSEVEGSRLQSSCLECLFARGTLPEHPKPSRPNSRRPAVHPIERVATPWSRPRPWRQRHAATPDNEHLRTRGLGNSPRHQSASETADGRSRNRSRIR